MFESSTYFHIVIETFKSLIKTKNRDRTPLRNTILAEFNSLFAVQQEIYYPIDNIIWNFVRH